MGIWLLAALAACGAEERGEPAPVEEGVPEAATVVPPAEPAPDEPEPPPSPGYARPFTPSAELVGRLRRGLRAHAAGDYEASRATFAEVLERAPDYHAARYDLACALARLGREAEAREAIERTLAADLPTFLPKALADEDLAPLGDHIERFGGAMEARYREASRDGDELVAFGREGGRHWAQAGFWTGQRFVPASPRVSARRRPGEIDAEPLTAAAVSADRDRAITVLSRIDQAEAGGLMPAHRVRLTEAFTGRLLEERGYPRAYRDASGATFGFGARGAWIRYDVGGGAHEVARLAGGDHADDAPPALEVSQDHWRPMRFVGAEARPRGRRLEREDGAALTLPRRHDAHRVHAWADHVVVLSSSVANCGARDTYTLAVFGPDGALRWSEHQVGQQALVEVRGGRLFVQNDDGLRLYADPASRAAITLPEGLGLSSGFQLQNPYC